MTRLTGIFMRRPVLTCLCWLLAVLVDAQNKCPANIGFELGNFTGWDCGIGNISGASGQINLQATAPVDNRQTLYNSAVSGDVLDQFGGFPVCCPNGSNFSVKLGNSSTGAQAEQVSYTFTIPSDQNNYSIVYHYAVVFQNPAHASWEQPKFTANVVDVQSGQYIGCSSFSYTASSSLPGFKQSTVRDSVFYKDWTPVTIKLSGMAGKTIRLEFTTNDCSKGGHFGYAYVDVNQNCTSPINGNVFCANSDQMTLIAPYGFAGYRWFNDDFSQQIGNKSTLVFKPVPAPNTRYALEVVPYPDQGCLDTLYTTVVFSPEPLGLCVKPHVDACISSGIDLTGGSVTAGSGSNLSFSWFIDETFSKYVQNPKKIVKSGTVYVVAENDAGCTVADSVVINIEPIPEFTVTDPAQVFRPSTVDITQTVTASNGVYRYTYWQDSLLQKSLPRPEAINEKGRYFIKGDNTVTPECTLLRPVNVKILDPSIDAPNIFSPNGDGINDTWRIPKLAYYPECIVEVYDRSGKTLFRSLPGYPATWDGTYNKQKLPVATYYYRIRLNSELPFVSGSISLIR
ncbi:T9SS type B sorting domain-containing protein [Sediminibacterium soli]|uniref:T9SS type B sorting domain-containing protein n=1 Tax=Sediminibacterium soli TaxID=2698829 RepID=UPI00137A9E77|nr:T9SS type B sorting domain-containing protein [Sediminibacterium soli]NCI46451.1 T9SS type B sorting domain-containing protein [Sediminibacterium soli]